MLKLIKNLFNKKYLSWEQYKARINFIDTFHFQEQTRKESIENMSGAGRL